MTGSQELVLKPIEEEEERGEPEVQPEEGKLGGTPVEELAVPAAGGIYKARIVEIREGVMEDFMDIERVAEALRQRGDVDIAERLLEQRSDPAVMIRFIVEELGVEDSVIYRKSFNPKSNFYRLVKMYGREDKELKVKKLRVGDYVVVKAVEDPRTGRVRFRPVLDDPSVLELLR